MVPRPLFLFCKEDLHWGVMEEKTVVKLISQYLHERGFQDTLKSLQTETGRLYSPDENSMKTGQLQAVLDDFALREKQRQQEASSVEHLFSPGKKEHANQMWCSFDGLCDGVNLLVVHLMNNGRLLFGGAKAQLGMAELPLPLCDEAPPITPVPTMHSIGTAGILCVALHPNDNNIVLCGSMDRCTYILKMELEQADIIQKISDHRKYVVRALWAPSGKYFVTGSYDHSLCIYKSASDDEIRYELVEKIEVNGAVEGLAFAKDTDEFIVGIRNDHLLHCYDLSSQEPVLTRKINLNKFGDDYVSFTPMHITFSPDGQFFLISTDRDRLILFSWSTGKQIANFYGSSNDELSQPRHCWDSSGKYIYGTSQDYSICVWEIRNQKLVTSLKGHTATVNPTHDAQNKKSVW